MRIKNIIAFILLLSITFCSSCGEYEALEIDKDARRVADSLFRAHKDSLSIVSDTMCAINHRKLFSVYLDSIKNVERDKIKKLLEK